MKKVEQKYRRERLERVPCPDAELREIEEFARSFDAPSYYGSYRRCAEIACARRHDSLEELRTCLYFEERRWRQCRLMGIEMREEDLEYIRWLVGMIRRRAASRLALAGSVSDTDCA